MDDHTKDIYGAFFEGLIWAESCHAEQTKLPLILNLPDELMSLDSVFSIPDFFEVAADYDSEGSIIMWLPLNTTPGHRDVRLMDQRSLNTHRRWLMFSTEFNYEPKATMLIRNMKLANSTGYWHERFKNPYRVTSETEPS